MRHVSLTKVSEPGNRSSQLTPDFVSLAWQIGAVGAASLVGLAVRLYRVAADPLSAQEIYTWDFAHQTVPFILGRLSHIETNPPLYYLLIKLVMRIGETEFLLRLPSVIAGTMAIPLIYVLGRLGGAPVSGVIGAGLLSLSGIAITYSRDARTYALLQVACLLAAIGAVIIVNHYLNRRVGNDSPVPRDDSRASRTAPRELLGWVLFTFASILGFYLHYTFAFEILVLACGIALAIGIGWFGGKIRIDRALILKCVASPVAIALGIAWGFSLAQSQSHSDNIGWMQVPTIREAIRLFIHVNGYTDVSRFQPVPSLIFIGLAAVGLVVGWRRSAAVLVCGMLFAAFSVVLFIVSQSRPVFVERSLIAPSFAVCLLAAYGTLSLARSLSALGTELLRRARLLPKYASHLPAIIAVGGIVALFGPAMISARNSVRGGEVWEPYDKVTAYLASVLKPGDAAAGTDGIIYYRQRSEADFSYFKLVEGNTSQAQVTYGSPTAYSEEVPKLARADRLVYLVLRENVGFIVSGQSHRSYARDVLNKVGHSSPPVASFGSLSIYRVPGACDGPAPCLNNSQSESSPVQEP
jgi:Dolichyl-phosphate-mannose-protein mannosyltransferase